MQEKFAWARARAEDVLVLMMGVMFCAFIAQVVFRYLINFPLGWTEELATFMWLWGILWGASFVMKNHEDMRFDLLYNLLSRKVRRVLTIFGALALVLVLIISVPATWSYIHFMRVEKSQSMGMPMNLVFIWYFVFVIATIVRHLGIAWEAWQGVLVEDANPILVAPPVIKAEP